MDIGILLAAVAAFGLPCTDPEVRNYRAHELPWPAAYVRSVDGQNIIAVREDLWNEPQQLRRVLTHELLHCGLYEQRERRGQPHPRSLDAREEMAVHAMTDVVLERVNRSVTGEPHPQRPLFAARRMPSRSTMR